jgi:methyl-accepting chemotaxis protein
MLGLFTSLFVWRYGQVSAPINSQFMDKGISLTLSLAGTIESITQQDLSNGVTLKDGKYISGDQLKEWLFDDRLSLIPESEKAAQTRLKDPEYAAAKQTLYDGSEIPLWKYELKYESVFDDYTDQRWQGIIDSYLRSETVVFALPVFFSNKKESAGYIPTHNTVYSPVGDESKDKWGSVGLLSQKYRANRIFNDVTGYNAAAVTDKVKPLVQTYPRLIDGKVVTMWDISTPLYFDGKHWGAVRVAISKQIADEVIAEQRTQILIQYLFMFVIIMLVLLVLSVLLVKGKMTRLTAKTKSMFANGRVDLTEEFESRSKDEIGRFSSEMNHLLYQLRQLVFCIQSVSSEVTDSGRKLKSDVAATQQSAEVFYHKIDEISSGANQQAIGAQQGAIALNEMANGVQRIAESICDIASSSHDTLSQLQTGMNHIQIVIGQMNNLLTSTISTKEVILILHSKSAEIGTFASFITDISNQTNILSLNASIEASRAGEHGRGFQVIASEIRNLAIQSKASSDRILTMIKEIQSYVDTAVSSMTANSSHVQESVEVVNQVGESLGKIVFATQSITSQAEDVSATAEELSASVEEVTATVDDMASISEESATHIQSAASTYKEQLHVMEGIMQSAEDLNGLAERLEEEIRMFKIDENGTK